MIVRNKLTQETLVLSSVTEFKAKFAKEIEVALDSYERTILAKPYFELNRDI